MPATANPYTAPDAELETGTQVNFYSPSVFSFKGRLGRIRYFAYGFGTMTFFMALAGIVFAVVIPAASNASETAGLGLMAVMAFYYAGVIVLAVMFGKRRLNDLNRSGWWLALNLVPITNILLALYMMFAPGKKGPNNFGPAPAPNSAAVIVCAWLVIGFIAFSIVTSVAAPVLVGATQ